MNLAIVGATGAVGVELIRLLEERDFPVGELRLLASARSAGRTMDFRGTPIVVREASADAFEGIDIAFFSAGASRTREFASAAMEAGAVVIDNSSAYRMDPTIPLVVPEINFDAIKPGDRLIANPNCSAILLLMAIAPLRALGTIKRLIVSTYQSASGAGAAAMEELEQQTRDVLEGKPAVPSILPHVYAFNLFSHNTPINEQGYNDEEWKVIQESRKILGMPDLAISPTCVRVPVLRAHTESVTIEFDGKAPSVEDARKVLEVAAGVQLVDDRERNVFPMPLDASGKDDVLVGRLRTDISNPNALSLLLSGDQLRKGAALNAIQIAERLLSTNFLTS